jgi:dienelactone hydrolase
MGVPPVIRIRASLCQPRILAFFQKLRSSPPPFPTAELKVGVAGFCWGGQFTVALAQDLPTTRVEVSNDSSRPTDGTAAKHEAGKARLIDCAFTAHPALLKMPDIEKVSIPLSVSIGVQDEWMNTKDIAQMKKVLDAKTEAAGECQCVLLEGAKHGFAVRSWEGDKVQMGFADVAEKQALEWFEKWMG